MPRVLANFGIGTLVHWPYRGYGLFETGAPDQRGRPILRFLVQIVFVEREHLAAAHEDPAIDYDGVGASAMSAIDQVGNRIVNGLPLGPHDVEQRDVGFLADFERAEIPVPLHAPGAVNG